MPGAIVPILRASSRASPTDAPSSRMMTSPLAIPALAAGLLACASETRVTPAYKPPWTARRATSRWCKACRQNLSIRHPVGSTGRIAAYCVAGRAQRRARGGLQMSRMLALPSETPIEASSVANAANRQARASAPGRGIFGNRSMIVPKDARALLHYRRCARPRHLRVLRRERAGRDNGPKRPG